MATEMDSASTRDEMVFGDPHHPCHLGITDTREDGNSTVGHTVTPGPMSPDLEMLGHHSLLFLLHHQPLHKFSSQQNLSSVVINAFQLFEFLGADHTHHGCDEGKVTTSS